MPKKNRNPVEIVKGDKPRRARRLRVVAEATAAGLYGFVRDVYLESRPPPGEPGCHQWHPDLCNLCVRVELVADLMKWAHLSGLDVRQEPAGNMAAYFLRFREDQPELFQ